MIKASRSVLLAAAALVGALALLVTPVRAQTGGAAGDGPIRVFATIPDLGALAREVGGDDANVSVMVLGPQDPHFFDARPSAIRLLSEADVFLLMGMDLEVGYVPLLLQNARNYKVIPGGPGYVDASAAITPLQVPVVPVDRSMGDIHAMGNPHYLLDPVNGVRVAELIRTTFQQFRPLRREGFEERYQQFRHRVAVQLVGEELAGKYDVFKLATLYERGRLAQFLESQGDADRLGGWLGRMRPHRGAKVVDDHNMWPYFAHRFGIEVIGDMEPRPGIPPTTRHLEKLIGIMKAENVRAILAAPYYDKRHAQLVANATGAKVVEMTHQVGGRPGTDSYTSMIDLNVRRLADALDEEE